MKEPARPPNEKFNERNVRPSVDANVRPSVDANVRPSVDANAGNGVQAGCGVLFGLILPLGGGFAFHRSLFSTPGLLVIACITSALICGALAYKYGDRFWENGRRWW